MRFQSNWPLFAEGPHLFSAGRITSDNSGIVTILIVVTAGMCASEDGPYLAAFAASLLACVLTRSDAPLHEFNSERRAD